MSMKTSQHDLSNAELLKEIRHEIRAVVDSSKEEILEVVHGLAQHMDERFNGVDQRFEKAESRMDKMEFRLNRVESLMVTKDYLDDKLADLKSDIRQDTAKQIAKALH